MKILLFCAILICAMVSERQETVPGIFEGQFQHFGYFDYYDHIHSSKNALCCDANSSLAIC